MVMRADVLAASLDAAALPGDPRPRLIMSPRGEPFTQGAPANGRRDLGSWFFARASRGWTSG